MNDFYTTVYMFRNLIYEDVLNDTANITNVLKKKIIAFRSLNFAKYAREVIMPDAEKVAQDLDRQIQYLFASNDLKGGLQSASIIKRTIQFAAWSFDKSY
jgi:hypothetical protein